MKKPFSTHKIRAVDKRKSIMECGTKYWMKGTDDWKDTTCKNCLKWRPK